MLSFSEYLTEKIEPSHVANSPHFTSYVYDTPSQQHKIYVLFHQLLSPDPDKSGIWQASFGRKAKDSKSMTVSRTGMSAMSQADRVSSIRSVLHGLNTFIKEKKPRKITYDANTKKKGSAYKSWAQKAVDSHNRENKLGPNHPLRARVTPNGAEFPFHAKG